MAKAERKSSVAVPKKLVGRDLAFTFASDTRLAVYGAAAVATMAWPGGVFGKLAGSRHSQD